MISNPSYTQLKSAGKKQQQEHPVQLLTVVFDFPEHT